MIDITISITPIDGEYPNIKRWAGSISLKGGEDDSILHWNISDAKDGDVLNSPSHHLIWIYKDNEHYYACVNMNYVTENVAIDGLINIPNDACPATKLQRDILFSKIKEAGYEWDADKKELKKIEQKPAWSEEDKKTLERVIRCIENHDYMNVDDIQWLKSLKQRYTWKPSDEQLDALQYVYKNLNPPLSDKLGWNSLKTLELMYHDLKKL